MSAAPAPPTTASGQHPIPLRDRVKAHGALRIFTVINVITIIAALLCAMAELLSLIYIDPKTLPGFTVRLYCLGFLIVVILSELEWTHHVRESPLVRSWFWRGATYVFVAALVYEMKPPKIQKQQGDFILFASIVLLVVGFLYALMGLLFIKRWRDTNLAKYRTMRAHAEMADMLQQDPAMNMSASGGGRGPPV